MDTQYKICHDAQVKLSGSDDGPGEIEFYVTTWANWDRVRPVPERPVKGSTLPYLDEFIKDGWLGESHRWEDRSTGTIKDAWEDEIGTKVRAEFHGTIEGQQARQNAKERMARGKSVKTSMGYRVLADEYVPIDDETLKAEGVTEGRLLLKVPIFEASLVNRPANPQAVAVGVKALSDGSLAGLRLSDHLVAVHAAVKGVTDRVAALLALRQQEGEGKEGRMFSGANRQLLLDLLAGLDATDPLRKTIKELLAATEPKAAPQEVIRLLIEQQALLARIQEQEIYV